MAKARDFTIEFHESMGLTDVPGENDASRSKTFNQMDLRPGQTQAGTWFFSNSYSGAGAMACCAP